MRLAARTPRRLYRGPIILRAGAKKPRKPKVVTGQTVGKVQEKRSTMSLLIGGRWYDLKVGHHG